MGKASEHVLKGLGERLRSAIVARGESVNAFAAKCAVSESLVRQYLRGAMPRADKLDTISRVLGVSPEWLLRGDAGSPAADVLARSVDLGAGEAATALADTGQVVAGVRVDRDLARTETGGRNPDKLILLRAMGDAMAPTIAPRSLLVVDTSERDVESGEGIFVLRTNGHLTVRRMQRGFDGFLYLRTDNPAYASQRLQGAVEFNLRIVGRVLWVCQPVGVGLMVR